jgi:hemerythrin HHE cation binding domain-containing protein
MSTEITRLENPIDVMYLIHKALQTEAVRVEEMVRQFETGDSLQPIRGAFNFWATALIFHADQEDRYMTAPLNNFQPARDNEKEHEVLGALLRDLSSFLGKDDSGGLAQRVKEAIVALHEQQHAELMQRLEDVMAALHEEIGKTRVIARTQRHLYGKVVALRVAQDDHLESEEAFVLPEIWQHFNREEQLEMARHLLIDEEADDPRWVIRWVGQCLSIEEQRLLAGLEAQFNAVPAEVS